jgi:hypothetical protein
MDGGVDDEWTYNRKATYMYTDEKSKHSVGHANE